MLVSIDRSLASFSNPPGFLRSSSQISLAAWMSLHMISRQRSRGPKLASKASLMSCSVTWTRRSASFRRARAG